MSVIVTSPHPMRDPRRTAPARTPLARIGRAFGVVADYAIFSLPMLVIVPLYIWSHLP